MSKVNCEIIHETFTTMNFVPESESYLLAEKWSKEHDFRFHCFVDGKWQSGDDSEDYHSISPENSRTYSSLNQQWKFLVTSQDKTNALQSSRNAFETWKELSGHERSVHLYNISKNIQKQQQLFAELESLDGHKPLYRAKAHIIPCLTNCFDNSAGWAELWDTEMKQWIPLGATVMESQYNSLMPLCLSLCQALAAGNTVVLVVHPCHLSVLLLAEVCSASGLPPGVLNVIISESMVGSLEYPEKLVVFSPFDAVADSIVDAPDADLHIGMWPTVVILEGADLDSAASGVLQLFHAWDMGATRGCRLLVQDSIRKIFLEKLETRFQKMCVHSPDQECNLSTKITKESAENLQACLNKILNQGVKILRLHQRAEYFSPTIVTEIQTSSTFFDEKVLGPVMVVLPFHTFKEAIAMSNHDRFRSPVSIWTERLTVAIEFANRIKSGTIWVNCQNEIDAVTGCSFSESMYQGGKRGLMSFVKPAWLAQKVVKMVTDPSSGNSVEKSSTVVHKEISNKVDPTFKLYYGGRLKDPIDGMSSPVYSYDGQVLGYISESTSKDSNCAVQSAHSAALKWSKQSGQNCTRLLLNIARELDRRKEEFAADLTKSTGLPYDECRAEVNLSVQRLYYWASCSNRYGGLVQSTHVHGVVYETNEPLGVISIFCPDEKPLLSFVSLFAPAVAKRNAVIMVPSDLYPVPCLKMHQVFDSCGVPDGVINIMSGSKDCIVNHSGLFTNVDAVWFHMNDKTGITKAQCSFHSSSWKKWVSVERDWTNPEQGQGEEFLLHCTYTKTVWIPGGDICC